MVCMVKQGAEGSGGGGGAGGKEGGGCVHASVSGRCPLTCLDPPCTLHPAAPDPASFSFSAYETCMCVYSSLLLPGITA